jgi:phosphohistidine swiveling domain-containing protein
MSGTELDPYHEISGANTSWSRVNAAESALGVQTPLSLTFWDAAGEMGFRIAYVKMGLMRRSGLEVPAAIDDQCIAFFYGQEAVNIDLFRLIFANMPGAAAVERGVFSSSQAKTANPASTRWRRTCAAIRLPITVILLPSRLRRLRNSTERFWSKSTAPGASQDVATATATLADVLRRFPEAVAEQVIAGTIAGIFYGRVQGLVVKVGRADLGLKIIGGYGQMSEIQLTKDLARVAGSNESLSDFLARYGFHGPAEGEMSSFSWREDPEPVERMLKKFRDLPSESNPEAAEHQQLLEREEAENLALHELSGVTRLKARVLLTLCRHYIPLRVEAKAAFTQIFDVARASARVIGEDWAKRGLIDSREDIFYMTVDEILEAPPADIKAAVSNRRGLRAKYQEIELPLAWTGIPEPITDGPDVSANGSAGSGQLETLTAVGGSSGIAEGIARVILDASNPDALQPGEILICHVTDPSWSAFFFLAAAVVIDIGGAMSHGAIVARELGIPCVINTMTGTKAIRSGDRVRVDGEAGTVQILERA